MVRLGIHFKITLFSWLLSDTYILRLDLSPYKSLSRYDGPIVIAVDSSGVSVHKCGGWVEKVYGGKKRYIKMHFAVNVKTKEVAATHVTTDDVHDAEVPPSIMANASRHRATIEAFMDGAYDSSKNYAPLRGMSIKPIIKPRRNARVDRGPPERRSSAIMFKTLGEKAWSRAKGYGRRWSAETAFSTFKRLYGEYCMAKSMENITKELSAKAYIYNMLINLQN
jgi:hypothetical protein